MIHKILDQQSCIGEVLGNLHAGYRRSMHARTDQDIFVETPRDVRSSRYWRRKSAMKGTRNASQQWQTFSTVRTTCKATLMQLGVPEGTINVLRGSQEHASCTIRGHGDVSSEFQLHRAAKEACPVPSVVCSTARSSQIFLRTSSELGNTKSNTRAKTSLSHKNFEESGGGGVGEGNTHPAVCG